MPDERSIEWPLFEFTAQKQGAGWMERLWKTEEERRVNHADERDAGIGWRGKLDRLADGIVWLLLAIGSMGVW